jgi:hypothetical protein
MQLVLVLIISVPIVLLLIWAVVHDTRQRRRKDPLTAHDPRKAAKDLRMKSEGKGTEWMG